MTDERKDSLPDEEFEAYLEGRSKVSRGYRRLRDVEPPPELDRAVLREARAAAESSGRRRLWSGSWWPRVAVAATLLLAIGVALQFDSAPIDTLPQPETSIMADAPSVRSVTPESPSGAAMRAAESPRRESDIQRLQIARPKAAAGNAPSPEEAGDQALGAMQEPPESAPRRAAGLDDSARELEMSTREPTTRFAEQQQYRSIKPVDETDEAWTAYFDVGPSEGDGWPADLEAALRSRLSAGREPADEDELVELEERLLGLEDYLYGRSTDMDPLLVARIEVAALPPRDDWLALIDALIDVGDTRVAQRELLQFAEAWPDYPLEPRHEALLQSD